MTPVTSRHSPRVHPDTASLHRRGLGRDRRLDIGECWSRLPQVKKLPSREASLRKTLRTNPRSASADLVKPQNSPRALV